MDFQPTSGDAITELNMLLRRGIVQGFMVREFFDLPAGYNVEFRFDSSWLTERGYNASVTITIGEKSFVGMHEYRECEDSELMYEILPGVARDLRTSISRLGDSVFKSGGSDASLN